MGALVLGRARSQVRFELAGERGSLGTPGLGTQLHYVDLGNSQDTPAIDGELPGVQRYSRIRWSAARSFVMACRIDAAISGVATFADPARCFRFPEGRPGLIRGEGGTGVGGPSGRVLRPSPWSAFRRRQLDHVVGVGQGAAKEHSDERDL